MNDDHSVDEVWYPHEHFPTGLEKYPDLCWKDPDRFKPGGGICYISMTGLEESTPERMEEVGGFTYDDFLESAEGNVEFAQHIFDRICGFTNPDGMSDKLLEPYTSIEMYLRDHNEQ